MPQSPPSAGSTNPTSAQDLRVDLAHVVFRLGGRRFATPLAMLDEILPPLALSDPPKAPGWLRGLVNRRGEILGVVDVRQALQLDVLAETPAARLLVVPLIGESMAVMVEAIEEIRDLPLDSVVSTENLMGPTAEFFGRAWVQGGELVAVLDLRRLLSSSLFALQA